MNSKTSKPVSSVLQNGECCAKPRPRAASFNDGAVPFDARSAVWVDGKIPIGNLYLPFCPPSGQQRDGGDSAFRVIVESIEQKSEGHLLMHVQKSVVLIEEGWRCLWRGDWYVVTATLTFSAPYPQQFLALRIVEQPCGLGATIK